jgi:hypothetical protein
MAEKIATTSAGMLLFSFHRDGSHQISLGLDHFQARPAGCYYQFCNSGDTPLVMARIGAGPDKSDMRLNPDGTPVPGRTHEQGAAKPVLIEGAFFE